MFWSQSPLLVLSCSLLLLSGSLPADEPQTGFIDRNPAEDLPEHITRLTWFGERPDWRHDGERFAFVGKIFGELFEYELSTGRVYPLSSHFFHHGFTRIMYLSNGDYLLVGPSETFDRTDSTDRKRARHDVGRLYILDRSLKKPPYDLGIEVDEGPAVSRAQLKIAWTHGAQAEISTGFIVYNEEGVPELKKSRQVADLSSFPLSLNILETQSFIPPEDEKITVAAYQFGLTANTDTFSLDLESGELVNLSDSADAYDEPEGIFPDGKFTTVEHAPHRGRNWPLIDLFKLALDGSGDLERLTYFSDYKGWKASQGVVSDDGRSMLFQIGREGDEAGRGYGVFLFDLEAFSN